MIRCFFLTPTEQVEHRLRRYVGDSKCPGPMGYHNAMGPPLGILSIPSPPRDGHEPLAPRVAAADPRWPTACACGYAFTDADERQSWTERLYSRSDNQAVVTLRDAPVGAIWDCWWYPDHWRGPDGMSLCCRCPGNYDWMIDGRASNCTLPNDLTHRCWTRQGVPPDIDVDKNYGPTCAAGAGSIALPNWHGFLTHGYLNESRISSPR